MIDLSCALPPVNFDPTTGKIMTSGRINGESCPRLIGEHAGGICRPDEMRGKASLAAINNMRSVF